MFSLFGEVGHYFDFRRKLADTESFVNKLHYRFTSGLLFGCTILVTSVDWIGNDNKIACSLEGSEDSWSIPAHFINTYCYITSTFTLPSSSSSIGRIGLESVAPGVGNYVDNEESYKAYYQWVPFVLFLQGILFYLPHGLHKMWEGRKVQSILSGLNTIILDQSDRITRQKNLAGYLSESLHTHNLWAWKITLITLINLINVLFNIYFVDVFLGGEFRTYGFEVVRFLEEDPESRIDPMTTIFPRITKCTFHKFGPSGTVQRRDALCVLSINIINEKVYVFLWFWFVFLAVASLFGFLYDLVFTMNPGMIKTYLKTRTMNQNGLHLDEIGSKCQIGDWKLLSILGKNMEPVVFGEFLKQLYKSLKKAQRFKTGGSYKSITDSSDL